MLDRQAELGIMDPGPWAGRFGLDHHQPPVDLRPPVHPRRILLADEAALGEADPVQFGRVAFQPEDIAQLGPALADAEAQAVFEPFVLLRRQEPRRAQRFIGFAGLGPCLRRGTGCICPPAR